MYLFFLGNIQLPIAPSKIQTKIKNQNKTINLINDSEINLIKAPGLTELSFNCLLPNVKYPFASYPDGFKSGTYYLELLKKLKVEKKVFYFFVIRMYNDKQLDFDSSMSVTLESYTITEDAKNGIDFEITINLKQFVNYGTKILSFNKDEDSAETTATITEERAVHRDPLTSYTVKSGDNLWEISKVHLGDGARYKEIYTLNQTTIEAEAKKRGQVGSSNGRYIYPGTVLSLPV